VISRYFWSDLVCTSLYNMVSWADQQLAMLRPQYPNWDIWAVRTVIPSGYVWCARPKGHPVATINADSPEQLVAEIREQEHA
jgi:hypothetical protein